MSSLTPEQSDVLEQRRAGLDKFLEERMPVLAEFAGDLELRNPNFIVVRPGEYLENISRYLSAQQMESDETRVWLASRLGYFIGEILVQRLGGHWCLNERPGSRFFARYVVGNFKGAPRASAEVDPFLSAGDFVRLPQGRDLGEFIAAIQKEVLREEDGETPGGTPETPGTLPV